MATKENPDLAAAALPELQCLVRRNATVRADETAMTISIPEDLATPDARTLILGHLEAKALTRAKTTLEEDPTTQGRRRSRGRSASSFSTRCTASPRRLVATRQWSESSPTAAYGWGRCCPCEPKTSMAKPSKSAASPTRESSSRAPRPTTASRTPGAPSPSQRPSPGCSKPRSTSAAPTAISSFRPQPAACGASATSTATSGSRPRSAQASISAPTSAATPTSPISASGINDADVAEIAVHRVETMLARYTHSLGLSSQSLCRVID
jgi:hypothetical protein